MSRRHEADIQFQLAVPPRPRRENRTALNPPAARPIPRLTKLLALAIKFDGLLRQGVVRDYADLARLGHVTRARMTQIMRLLDLAPDIQQAILFEQPAVTERAVRAVAKHAGWSEQRQAWVVILGASLGARSR